MKKRIIRVLVLLMVLVLPVIIYAVSLAPYTDSVTRANNYINKFSDRKKFLIFNKNYVYEKDGFGDSGEFKTGGMVSKSEYDLTVYENQSYLATGKEYWTLTSNGSNKYYIESFIQSKAQSSNSGTRVTQFIKPGTIIKGRGTFANPWTFEEGYEVEIKPNNSSFGSVSPNETKYVKAGSSLEYVLTPTDGYFYNGKKDDCNLIKVGGDIHENKYELSNINRDINCTAVFELRTYKFSLNIKDDAKDYKGVKKIYSTDPGYNPIYYKHKKDWYSDANTTNAITKINVPVVTGWTFEGYYYGSTKIIDSNGDIINKNLPISDFVITNQAATAQLSKNTFTISYNLNGGVSGSKKPTSSLYDEVIEIDNPTRAGYSFAGWSFNGNSSTAKYGETATNVNSTFTANSTKTKARYFANLNPTKNASVTLTANWESCPAGTYNDGSSTTCSACGAGKYSLEGSSSCINIKAGCYGTGGTSECPNKCAAGTYSKAGSATCTPCAAGTYSSNEGASTCTSCGAGKWSSEGSSTCNNINAGCYGTSATTACPNKCPAGKYSVAGSASCTNCAAGTYSSNEGSATCTSCGSGKYSTAGSSTCSNISAGCYGTSATTACPNKCAAGTYSAAGSASCTNCGAGKWSSEGSSTCSNIKAGCYGTSATTECPNKCQAGKYSTAGSSSCTNCAAGKYSAAGSASCSNCAAGTYSAEGAGSCTACGAGKYSAAGSATCSNINAGCYGTSASSACPAKCAAGTYSAAGSASCSNCAAGTYSAEGAGSCTACGAGKWSAAKSATCSNITAGCYGTSASTACPAKCAAGKYSTAGSASCSNCGNGKWSAEGSGSCSNITAGCYGASATTACPAKCAAGTYSAAGSASCSNCAAGTYSAQGAGSCTACGAGKWSAAKSATCSNITAGCYGTSAGTACPNKCAAGTYSGAGSASCSNCGAGTYSAEGASTCTACGAGKWSAAKSATCSNINAGCYGTSASSACPAKCAAGKYSAAGSASCSNCAAGYFSGEGASACSKCGTGTYSASAGSATCTACAAGTYNASTGATSCTACPQGSYNTTTGQTSCVTCPAGKYCTGGTNNTVCPDGTYRATTGGKVVGDCTSCPAGTEGTGEGKTSQSAGCTACVAGRYSAARAASCSLCAAGTYNTGTGNTSCTSCAAGYYNTGTGNTGCSLCDNGYYCTGGANRVQCPANYRDGTALANKKALNTCLNNVAAGYRIASANAAETACDTGYYSTAHSVTYGSTSSCTQCPTGYRDGTAIGNKTSQNVCLNNVAANRYVATAKADDVACPSGYESTAHTVLYGGTSSCTAAYTCPENTTMVNDANLGWICTFPATMIGEVPVVINVPTVTFPSGCAGSCGDLGEFGCLHTDANGCVEAIQPGVNYLNNDCLNACINGSGNFTAASGPMPTFACPNGNVYSGMYSETVCYIPANSVSVSFNANGGTVSPTGNIVVRGSSYGSLPTPTRSEIVNNKGYGFTGWYTAASGGTRVTSSTTVTATGNHTIYAHWSLNRYCIEGDFSYNSSWKDYVCKKAAAIMPIPNINPSQLPPDFDPSSLRRYICLPTGMDNVQDYMLMAMSGQTVDNGGWELDDDVCIKKADTE